MPYYNCDEEIDYPDTHLLKRVAWLEEKLEEALTNLNSLEIEFEKFIDYYYDNVRWSCE